jgi:uncharacterized lipoprotein YehR (DUF1307 family)
MKIQKSMIYIALAIVFTFSLTACGNSKQKGEEARTEATGSLKSETSSASKQQVGKVLKTYLAVKDALVQTDGEAASTSALELVTILEKAEGDLMEKIRFDAQHIAETKEVSHQRDHFNTLSDHIYQWVKDSESNESTLYRQYCPMAFNNQGAFWLSDKKEILNPYFGDRMLRCGSVKETLAKN